MPGSRTRPKVWDGFLDYLQSWANAEDALGVEVLRGVWIGGSFISAALDPSDIDVSPIYEADTLDSLKGTAGIGEIKRLIKHRERVAKKFSVEPFPVPWVAIASTLFPEHLDEAQKSTLAIRGGIDSWWGRVRPPGPKSAPEKPTTLADRGYLEVILR